MIVPIILFNEMQGVICAVNAQNSSGRFEQEDLELFSSLAVVATLSKNMIETYSQMADQQRMQQELEFARQIQETLTPSVMPDFAHLDIFAHNIPAKEVSGDFYDFITIF